MSDEKKIELLPCPFCGGEAYLQDWGEVEPRWNVGCNNNECKISSVNDVVCETEEEAFKIWNTRANQQALADKDKYIEELEWALKPFANFACDDNDPCSKDIGTRCYNCKAKQLLGSE
jgi:hypothetical protein